MTTRDERLEQFFGAYFHQDWDIDGATSWRDVIGRYATKVPRPMVVTIRKDLEDWLEESKSDPNENLPPSFDCEYDPRSEGLTERQWVCLIVDELGRLLSN